MYRAVYHIVCMAMVREIYGRPLCTTGPMAQATIAGDPKLTNSVKVRRFNSPYDIQYSIEDRVAKAVYIQERWVGVLFPLERVLWLHKRVKSEIYHRILAEVEKIIECDGRHKLRVVNEK